MQNTLPEEFLENHHHQHVEVDSSLSDDNLVPLDFEERFKGESNSDECLVSAVDPLLNSGEHSPSILFDALNMSASPRKAMKLDIPNPITSASLERMNSNDFGKFTQVRAHGVCVRTALAAIPAGHGAPVHVHARHRARLRLGRARLGDSLGHDAEHAADHQGALQQSCVRR